MRTGIALFGGDEPSGVALHPAMRVVTRIAQLRWIQAGEAVSYGERWRADRASHIATLPVGYAHGYPRRLIGRGRVLVQGRACPIVGTICMEMMLVDVTDLGSEVGIDDEVVLIGHQGAEEITAMDLANQLDGIVEEIFCGISRSGTREYVEHGSSPTQRGSIPGGDVMRVPIAIDKRIELTPSVIRGLGDLAAAEGAGLEVALLAALMALVARYAGQDQVTVVAEVEGTPDRGRSRRHARCSRRGPDRQARARSRGRRGRRRSARAPADEPRARR